LENFKSILRERVPCWYELLWREQRGIILRIHTDFANSVEPIPINAPIVEYFRRDFGFAKFGRRFGEDFGFENSLEFLGKATEFMEYLIPTPLVRKLTDEVCHFCKGTGWDESREDTCLYCNGERNEIKYDYTKVYAVSATLTVLFELMRFPGFETTSTFPQLICIQTETVKGPHGGSLSGEYGQEVVAWLRRREPGEISEMVSAMRIVWEKMDGRMKDFDRLSFNANLSNNGWLCIDCPGDRCGLNPSSSYAKRGDGFKFSCHNTDTPMQQLVLLASLAALHDLVRKGTV